MRVYTREEVETLMRKKHSIDIDRCCMCPSPEFNSLEAMDCLLTGSEMSAHLRCVEHFSSRAVLGVPEWCVNGTAMTVYFLQQIGVLEPLKVLKESK